MTFIMDRLWRFSPVDFCVHFSVLMRTCLFVFFFYVWPPLCMCGEGSGGEGGVSDRVETERRTCVPLNSLWDITTPTALLHPFVFDNEKKKYELGDHILECEWC